MVIELTIVTDVFTTLPNGKLKMTRKDARITRSFESSAVNYQTYINSSGRPVKKYTTIIYGNEYLKAEHTMDEVKKRLGHYEIKGYISKSKYAKDNKNKSI